jgi:hypothetical protein
VFGLEITFFDMVRERAPFVVGPAFLGVLSFKCSAQNVLRASMGGVRFWRIPLENGHNVNVCESDGDFLVIFDSETGLV